MNASRTVYAVHLDIQGPPAKVRPTVRALARTWLVGRFGPWPEGADPRRCAWSPRPDETVTCRSAEAGGERFWEVVWRYPHEKEPTLRWCAVVLVGGDGKKAWAQVRYGLEAAPGCEALSGWVEYDARRPHLVHTLVHRLAVVDGDRRLSPAPMRVETPDDLNDLVTLVTNPSRRLPVIVGTRRPGALTPDAPLPALADSCIGLAHVADLVDPELTYDWNRLLNQGLDLHPGAMRIVFAGWSPFDPPHLHPLWVPEKMRSDRFGSFAHRISKRIFAVAAFRTPVPPLVDRVTVGANRARIAKLQALSTTQLDDTALEAWEQDLGRLGAAEQRVAALTEEVTSLTDENERLARELETARNNVTVVTRAINIGEPPPELPPTPPELTSVAAAIDWAIQHLRHLTFHPRALDTGRRCPYRWPNRLLDDLRALDDVVATWQTTGRLLGGWSGATTAAGLNWANGISDTARNQYRADYEITLDDGTKAVLGPHLRRGSGTGPEGHYRAYLHIDDTARTVIVGYIGPHLRDGSNP